MTRTLLVTGDLVWDTHLARLGFPGRGYYEPHPHTQLVHAPGGAWYLRDVIQAAIAAENAWWQETTPAGPVRTIRARLVAPSLPAPEQVEGPVRPAGIAKAVSVWQWFDGKKRPASARVSAGDPAQLQVEYKWPEGQAEPGAWRITEFLGCQAPTWPQEAADRRARPWQCQLEEPQTTDVLVLDDLGLGFAEHETSWPRCLRASSPSVAGIVVKATPPFRSILWDKLLRPEWAERTTVIVSAAALRGLGADIRRGSSWERTMEDLQHAFGSSGPCWTLRRCQRVVVSCGRSGVAVFSRVPQAPGRRPAAHLGFERLVFDSLHVEDTWSAQYEGATFGTGSALTAAFVCHALADERPSTHLAAGFGLAAARELHRRGAGRTERFHPVQGPDALFSRTPRAWGTFRSAFPRELLDPPVLVSSPQPTAESLLTDVVGSSTPFLSVAAEDIVRAGHELPLGGAPRLQYGDYFTVDQGEIENLNNVRALIDDYRAGSDKRPLSLAVFGPPGSGKGFAIKELARAVFGEKRASLEFNLSQLRDVDDLHEAFHEIRDKTIQRQLPLVFWDEFDCRRGGAPLGWLQEFLAPMQDAHFHARGKDHPFGQCIFVFAGGISRTMKEFDRSKGSDRSFKEAKGPDFVSRLRGYVNVKGPNPVSPRDDVHVVRRALLLRSLVKKHHPKALHPETKRLDIHPALLAAFLGVERYEHGARSMEAIVSLSHLHENRPYGPAELPPPEVARLHVSADFSRILRDPRYRLTPADVEELAKRKHDQWWAEKRRKHYVYGARRDDDARPPTHPLCLPFEQLPPAAQEGNRLPARLTILRLESLGFRILRAGTARSALLTKSDEHKLRRSEHRRWMREKLLLGYAYAPKSNDALLLHRDVCRWDALPAGEQALDEQIISAIFAFLRERRLVLVRGKSRGTRPRGKVVPSVSISPVPRRAAVQIRPKKRRRSVP